VDSFAELGYILRQHSELIIQEFIPGQEYTLDVLADLKGQVLSVVPRERLEVRSGEVSKSRTVYRVELIEQGKGIVEKLGAIGPITVQCIDSGEALYWLEINPRFGGGVPLSIHAGVDYPYLLYQMSREQKIQPLIGQYNHNLTMLRYDQAVYF
jgi:carbamoyl-phosphate synthase large subunit